MITSRIDSILYATQPAGIMRFRPEQHVRRQRDFRNLREKGRRLECGGFVFWYHKRPQDTAASSVAASSETSGPHSGVSRLGVVASCAAVGKAVARARAKRRLREVFRRHQQLVPPGHDIMLVARRSLNEQDFSVIEKKFADACRRAFSKETHQ